MKWDNNILHTEMPVTLDVGAAGKGRLVDMIAGLLDEAKLEEYVIDASGDLLHKGSSHNRVGLEHPRKPGTIIGIVDVQNQSLCASADNRRTWGNGLHHIFDPETKRPVRDIIATWVMTDEAMIADGLATALFFVGPTVLAETYTFQYIRMHADGSLDYSHDFGGELF
jgi:thiamine biosynthesis lipoprotein